MKTQQAKQRASLKSQVLHVLKQHPMTTAVLAAKLSAHPKAVDGHLYRMTKTGEVVKVGRGLYALPGTVEAAAAEMPSDPFPSQSVNVDLPRQRVEPAILKKLASEEIAENGSTDETSARSLLKGSHEEAVNLDDIDEFDDDIYMPGLRTTYQPKAFPASMPRELPTATPRWDRY
ncbi:MAG: type IV toxin-antitoxin system AbiEi family antitoxin domain-containing protein [Ignavibacteriota bacterium]